MKHFRHSYLTWLIFAWVTILHCPSSLAASNDQEYSIKAAFIEKFTHFITWPQDKHSTDSSNTFNICVLGNNPFGDKLDTLARLTKIKKLPVKIYYLNHDDDISYCDIAFITRLPANQINAITHKARDSSVLTIADTPGYGEQGVIINFYSKEQFLGFEINRIESDLARFRISSRLLKLANIIETHGGTP